MVTKASNYRSVKVISKLFYLEVLAIAQELTGKLFEFNIYKFTT
jgi:hypothetical protein